MRAKVSKLQQLKYILLFRNKYILNQVKTPASLSTDGRGFFAVLKKMSYIYATFFYTTLPVIIVLRTDGSVTIRPAPHENDVPKTVLILATFAFAFSATLISTNMSVSTLKDHNLQLSVVGPTGRYGCNIPPPSEVSYSHTVFV